MAEILDIFKAYNGTGYYCILFIAALMYLWFTEEDKHIKVLLVVVPSAIQLLFFIPYAYYIYEMLDEGTYYRVLWLLPMTMVIAYAGCRIIGNHTRAGVAVVMLILIFSGTCVYTNRNVTVAENVYNLPDEVIELCDIVKPEEGRERVWAAFPPLLVHYVRQYTTTIQLPFGRDSMVDSWKKLDNPLFELYMSPNMPADKLTQYATEYYCNYLILEKDAEVIGDLSDYGVDYMTSTENYDVYRNTNVPFWDRQEDEQDKESN
ncbi:MAG: hypothetical protein KBS96_05950 [Lachnospiraceae bacterium]|nr:hypothetical protein [Candidatus Colinaster scatohippi]